MIALITPTGGRPKQIQLCAKFMKHQDYQGRVLWVIVDDAEPITIDYIPDNFRENWKIIKVYPESKWRKDWNTQARNLLCGIQVVKTYKVEAVFIIEDDDYYSPIYLREMMKKLNGYLIAGEIYTVYYNPMTRFFRVNRNDKHSSLFQTVLAAEALNTFEKICQSKVDFIDIRLFKELKDKANLFMNGNMSIGIKGLPGRAGLGLGHNKTRLMFPDPYYEKLKELIGEDYKYYV